MRFVTNHKLFLSSCHAGMMNYSNRSRNTSTQVNVEIITNKSTTDNFGLTKQIGWFQETPNNSMCSSYWQRFVQHKSCLFKHWFQETQDVSRSNCWFSPIIDVNKLCSIVPDIITLSTFASVRLVAMEFVILTTHFRLMD